MYDVVFVAGNSACMSVLRPIHDKLKEFGYDVTLLLTCSREECEKKIPESKVYVESHHVVPDNNKHKTVYYYHGLSMLEWGAGSNVQYKLVLVPGEYYNIYSDKLLENTEVKIVGWTKSDILFLNSGKQKQIKEEVKKKFNLELPKQKTIAYMPTGVVGVMFNESIFPIIEIARRLNANLIVKPSLDRIYEKFNLNIATKFTEDESNINWIDSRFGDVTSLFLFADVLISDISSVLTEFMISTKPAIQLTNFLETPEIFSKRNVSLRGPQLKNYLVPGAIKSDIGNLENSIEKLFNNPSMGLEERTKWINRAIYKPDGHASERAANAIIKVIDENE